MPEDTEKKGQQGQHQQGQQQGNQWGQGHSGQQGQTKQGSIQNTQDEAKKRNPNQRANETDEPDTRQRKAS